VLLSLVLAGIAIWVYVDLARNHAQLEQRFERLTADLAAEQEGAAMRHQETQRRIDQLFQDLEFVRGQRAVLDEMLADLTRGRDELALLDVDRLVAAAAYELQTSGQVTGALAALQAADARLARVQRPQWINLRRAIGRDIERLRAQPAVDFAGIALRLDELARAVEGWPLLAEPAAPAAPVRPQPPAAKAPAVPEAAAPVAEGTWPRVRAWLAAEFGDLMRIREVDTPEALMLSVPQQRLVRLQFRLRLVNARQALLMRDEKIFRADIAEAQALLNRYFDVRQASVAGAIAQLRQLGQTPLASEPPSIADSLAAMRALRGEGAR
jgi:uncharacterized protein HemX